jgi:lipoprotein-anchoring transpeptidase ErfK/SrfK
MPFVCRRFLPIALLELALLVTPAWAARKHDPAVHKLTPETVNNAEWRQGKLSPSLLVRLQVLLDRTHASPGQIDATRGENTRKAIAAFREMHGLGNGEQIDQRLWQALTENDREPTLVTYTVMEKDVAGPFIEQVPKDYRDKASLKRLSYTSAQELLAEKFHMSEELLQQLNPKAAFDQAGTVIVVPNVQREQLPRRIARVEVDAVRQRVLAYDKDDTVVAAYPATVGSSERPSPSGEFKVAGIAENPPYHYDPSLNFRGVDVQEPLDLPPGPNNPVGVVWIALSAKGYGIHGTADPEAVSKRASHGCIRLTNWDALELAHHLHKGTPVAIHKAASGRQAKR